jgi:uncharacterized membrane protein YoaK (UPF0700 family)
MKEGTNHFHAMDSEIHSSGQIVDSGGDVSITHSTGLTRSCGSKVGDENGILELISIPYEPVSQKHPADAKDAHALVTPLHERDPLEFWIIIIGAAALAFNAGFINGCTVQFRNITVSHMTGTSTHIGLNVATGDWENLSLTTCLLVCFVFGSSITGFFVPESSFHLGIAYGPLFLIGSFLLVLSCLTSHYFPASYWYFYFAAMASGLQNALTSRYSGSIIRTTHVTGAATDIGLVLGKLALGNTKEVWKLKILLPIVGSFISGGAVSVFAYRKMNHLALVINVIIFFGIGLTYSIFVGLKYHIPVWRAFFGLYENVGRKFQESSEKAKAVVSRHAVSMRRAASEASHYVASPLRRHGNDEYVMNPLREEDH